MGVLGVGDRIGGYEIVTHLRTGGMATLYLARRAGAAGFSKHVAIKVIHESLASDDSFVRMFVDEAKLSAQISHPNVVHVEELGQEGDHYFLVMEYVHGCSLGDLIRALGKRSRRLGPALAVHIAMAVADGLHAAHEMTGPDDTLLGVVHRDVSPQNVLLSYQGHVKLIDFGIAKARGQGQQTTGGSLKGKFRYMSPEQAWGRPLDRRSDVYSLGVVLWESLTSQHLFRAENDLSILEVVRNPVIEPPSHRAREVPEEVDAVVLDALAARPEARIATAKELRRRLMTALPEAATLDRDRLANLLEVVMSERMTKSLRALPESVSGVVRPPPAPTDPANPVRSEDYVHALETLTLGDPGIEALEGSEPSTSVTADPSVIPPLRPPPARGLARVPRPLVVGIGALAALSVGLGLALGLRRSPGENGEDGAGAPAVQAAPPESPAPGADEGDEPNAAAAERELEPEPAMDSATAEAPRAPSPDAGPAAGPAAVAPDAVRRTRRRPSPANVRRGRRSSPTTDRQQAPAARGQDGVLLLDDEF